MFDGFNPAVFACLHDPIASALVMSHKLSVVLAGIGSSILTNSLTFKSYYLIETRCLI
jgi:hypothetical protein